MAKDKETVAEIEDLVDKATQYLLRGRLWEVYLIIHQLKKIALRDCNNE